ncbi:MAG: ABC transporter permease [Parcubacteria group bacterium]|jgi:ABC-type antimicrobial peptide transport system permease subunit
MHELIVSIKLALGNIRSNVGRTVLSLLGIVIGVVSVILVLALGAGVKGYVVGQIESFGSNIIQIEPKVPKVSKTSSENVSGQFGKQLTTLKLDDAKAVAKLSNIGLWYGGVMSQQVTSFENKNKQANIMGMTAGIFEADEKTEIISGEPFTEEDDLGLKQVAVLGSGIKKDLFGDGDAVGRSIKIKGQRFQVKGILKERGSSGFFDYDNTIYLPIRTLQKKLLGTDHIQFAVFKINDMSKPEFTILQATDVMKSQHNIKKSEDEDFAVNSIAEIKDILDKVFNVVDYLLLALTSISLVVGGVGIMNVMYVAVVERTAEIGLRKSIGAKKSDILKQFLFEAIFLTVLGGILGVAVGFFLAGVFEHLASNLGYDLKFPVTLKAIAIGFGFSAITGLIFGIYPAKKASNLSPMEALRKE